MQFRPPKCIFLQFQLKIVFAFLKNEAAFVDIFLFTYMNYYHKKVSGPVLFVLQFAAICTLICLKFTKLLLLKAFIVKDFFQPFLENTFGAVKTIMSNISRGRLLSHSPRGCGYSYGYCSVVTHRTGTTRNIC